MKLNRISFLVFIVSIFSLAMPCIAATKSPDVISKRTFFNADRSKSFEGELYEFNEFKKLVRISINGKVSTLKLDVLSKEDQVYVKKMAPYAAVARDVKLRFNEVTTKAVKKGTLSIKDFSYNITLKNKSGSKIDGLKMDYKIFYYIGDTKKAGSVLATKTGTKTLDVYPEMSDYFSTTKLELVKNVVKGTAGG